MIPDHYQSKQLNRDRWTGTWAHHGAYTGDLIAYLFRPGPYMRRIRAIQPDLLRMASELPLGEFVRRGAAAELQSSLDDPLSGLVGFVQSALPHHPAIRTYVQDLDDRLLEMWAQSYATLFPLYNVAPRPGISWRDVAELFTTSAEGAQFRVRARRRSRG